MTKPKSLPPAFLIANRPNAVIWHQASFDGSVTLCHKKYLGGSFGYKLQSKPPPPNAYLCPRCFPSKPDHPS